MVGIKQQLASTMASTALSSLLAISGSSGTARAAIIGVSDSGSWINGSNALANQGLNMMLVPNDPTQASFEQVSALSSPLGSLSFSPSVSKRIVGKLIPPTEPNPIYEWHTWSNGYTGEVYFTGGGNTLTIELPSAIAGFDLYIEPNAFDVFTIEVTASNPQSSSLLLQEANGNGGAAYFGFYTNQPHDWLTSISITAPADAQGFAIGQLRFGSRAIPTPALLPGLVSLGFCIWRKQHQKTDRLNQSKSRSRSLRL